MDRERSRKVLLFKNLDITWVPVGWLNAKRINETWTTHLTEGGELIIYVINKVEMARGRRSNSARISLPSLENIYSAHSFDIFPPELLRKNYLGVFSKLWQDSSSDKWWMKFTLRIRIWKPAFEVEPCLLEMMERFEFLVERCLRDFAFLKSFWCCESAEICCMLSAVSTLER